MFPPMPPVRYDSKQSGITAFNPQARPLFERARWRGNLDKLIASVARYSYRLLLLSDCVGADVPNVAHTSMIQAVDLNLIQGSVNRSEDFDRNFYPLNDRSETRWVRIASMMLQGTALPPVDLIRVGRIYFVVDGHHRVSVARMLKYATIDAVITSSYN